MRLEFVLIEAEETRLDRKRPTRRGKKHISLDQRLIQVNESIELGTPRQLLEQLPMGQLPSTFDTADLAAALERPRWFAQKVAYCLRQTGAAKLSGKRGNNQLYQVARFRKKWVRAA